MIYQFAREHHNGLMNKIQVNMSKGLFRTCLTENEYYYLYFMFNTNQQAFFTTKLLLDRYAENDDEKNAKFIFQINHDTDVELMRNVVQIIKSFVVVHVNNIRQGKLYNVYNDRNECKSLNTWEEVEKHVKIL